jgi:hypothetical protein
MAREAIPGISAGCVLQRLYRLARANYRLFRLSFQDVQVRRRASLSAQQLQQLGEVRAAMRRVLAVHIMTISIWRPDPGFEPRLCDHARPLRMHSAIGPQGL